MVHDFSSQEMLLFLQHKQMNVLCGLYTLGNAKLGSWPREGLDIFLKAFRPCANHLVLRVKEGAGEIATGGKGKYTATWHGIWWQWLLASCGGT